MITMASSSKSTDITPQACAQYWAAAFQRDPRADGKFFLAVPSTHIYCRPTCPARRPLRENAVFFRTPQEAEKNGYRPCRRCRPTEPLEGVLLVKQAAKLLGNASEEDSIRLGPIAAQLRASTAKLRRVFHRVTGLSPREFAHAARLEKFKRMLRDGAEISEALYACGYGSPSRVYEKTNAALGMTPASYRKGGAGMKIGFTVAASSLGKVLVAGTERGISAVYLGEDDRTLGSEIQKEDPRGEIASSAAGKQKRPEKNYRRVGGPA